MSLRPIASVLVAGLSVACSPWPLSVADGESGGPTPRHQVHFVSGAEGFPAERDLAILLPLDAEAWVRASTPTASGDALLSERWVEQVSAAFDGTLAEGAIGGESIYADWRLVSARVVPCAPVARAPALAPASVCWPMVRLVWQPVAPGVNLWGVEFDAFADDRAIHALYPVHPRAPSGDRTSTTAHDRVTRHLDQGGRISELSEAALEDFDRSRDDTTRWLLDALHALRDPSLAASSWSGIEVRPELQSSDEVADAFIDRFVDFLGEFASPVDLREMTAFSLPEGRNPAGDDAWVFVQLKSDGRSLWQEELEVYSRTSGDLLLAYGPDQTVGQSTESAEVEAALRGDGPGELHETVVESSVDIDEVAELVTDPEQVFVPNTTCATCHRMNGLRFDFHSLSHLEDRPHTVSPRVEADVERELAWVQQWVWDGAPATLEAPGTASTESTEDPAEEVTEDPTDDPTEAYEPNESPESAARVVLPFDARLEITEDDVDHFAFEWSGGVVEVGIRFSHAHGDLDLTVSDAAGNTVGSSVSTSDNEEVALDLSPGRYVVRVEGYLTATGPYRIRMD